MQTRDKTLTDLRESLKLEHNDRVDAERRLRELQSEVSRLANEVGEARKSISKLKRLYHESLIANARLQGNLDRVAKEDLDNATLVELEQAPVENRPPRIVPKHLLPQADAIFRAETPNIGRIMESEYRSRPTDQPKHFTDL